MISLASPTITNIRITKVLASLRYIFKKQKLLSNQAVTCSYRKRWAAMLCDNYQDKPQVKIN